MTAAGSQVYTLNVNTLTYIISISAPTKTFKILPISNNVYYEMV